MISASLILLYWIMLMAHLFYI